MMYGFGDDPNPLPESVALMEDIVVEYVTELVHKAQDIGSQRRKLSVEDFLYLIRKDSPKLYHCTELLSMNEELKHARKVFESDEEKLRKVFEVDAPTKDNFGEELVQMMNKERVQMRGVKFDGGFRTGCAYRKAEGRGEKEAERRKKEG